MFLEKNRELEIQEKQQEHFKKSFISKFVDCKFMYEKVVPIAEFPHCFPLLMLNQHMLINSLCEHCEYIFIEIL